jgi:hypothetical protein
MDWPELTPWKLAMLVILPLLTRGPKLRAWLAVFASAVLAWLFPLSPSAYLLIDLACGALVLAKPAGVAQKSIGTVFAIMAIIDAGYLLSPQADHGILYYWIMLTLGWVQFAVLAAWGSYDAGTYLSRRFGVARRTVASGADI